MCHEGFIRAFVINPITPVSLVQSGEDLMRFVDHGEIEGRGGAEGCRAAFAAGEFSADQIHAWCEEARVVLTCLDSKQVQQLALPLPDQRLGYYQQDALSALGSALGNDQASLNRLSQTNLVCENATTFAKTSKRKDHRVNLVGVGINPSLALGSRIAFPFVRTADPDEVLGENPLVEGMHVDSCLGLNFDGASLVGGARNALLRREETAQLAYQRNEVGENCSSTSAGATDE